MPSTALTKDCPRCHVPLSIGTDQCTCGYLFVPATTPGVTLDLVTQAEVLYETHLRARLQRAMRLTRVAKVELLRDPTNVAKKAQLRQMEKEALLLEKQLDLQGTRIEEARAAAQRSSVELTAAAVEHFRAAQGIKAEQSLESNRLQRALDERTLSQATGAFNATQADKARNVVEQRQGIQTCPNCNAAVKIGLVHCQCGYRLRSAQDDKEFLSTDELTALRENT